MSNHLAIRAVTELLLGRIQTVVGELGARASAFSPDKAAAEATTLVNLFLYQTTVDGHWRNEPFPGARTRAGERPRPPLPLVLRYLVTPFINQGDDLPAHELLGAAMRELHDYPEFSGEDLAGGNVKSDVAKEVESVKISPISISTDEISKLWSAFQTQYRITVGYEVRIVLIESRRGVPAAPPVLRRGKDDRGPVVEGSAAPPFPLLTAADLADNDVLAGEPFVLRGLNLTAGPAKLRLTHPVVPKAVELTGNQIAVTATEVRAVFPNDPDLGGGLWSAAVHLDTPEGERVTNSVPLPVGAGITAGVPSEVSRDIQGVATIQVSTKLSVHPGQRAFLLVGPYTVTAEPITDATRSLVFRMANAKPGSYLTRLRVDGVDSRIIIRRPDVPPVFDESQKVVIV
ncbi:DUF4255 domain-containing protein [Allokutzneria sp. A3M-2-11 16]|uniref:DUF4255 domain-containing protein n=1 Tax=Allokutzneria sp. A3M-2-11 16 TaxID=2962043 RepID=UPI0020B7CCD6|nr:DUF4255 domain-containing protein [Allokutzneria sp. A3M-2-11 16]MCP3804200.1 DUF4255 domain-containing protein [Allokutzneria sp. A3M-2-11 16]